MTALMPGRRALVSELEAAADGRIEEALGLPGPGAGGNERRAAPDDGPHGPFLMGVEPRDPLGNSLAEMRMQHALSDEVGDLRAASERP